MSYLKSIAWLSVADNIGGIVSLQVARAADIAEIPAPVDGVVFGDITFLQGGFFAWNVSSAGARSDGSITREGPSKANRLPFTIPKDRADIRTMLSEAEDDEFIILYKENGVQKIFGTLEAPVKFRFDHSTGTTTAQLNRYACEFYFDGPDNIYEYDGEVAAAPAGTAPAIVRFKASNDPGPGTVIGQLAPGETLTLESDFGFDQFYVTS